MDLAKYRALFLEEATEHLASMSRALLALEKDAADAEAIGEMFRMAHSIKGMAGSLGYDSITALSHRLEDRMERVRDQGRVDPGEAGLPLLFRGLEGLEAMVAHVRDTGESPSPMTELEELLAAEPGPQAAEPAPPGVVETEAPPEAPLEASPAESDPKKALAP